MISLDSAGLGLSLVIFWGQLWDLWSCYPACTSEDSQKHIFESECFSSGNEIGKENTNYCEIFSGNVRSQVSVMNILFSKLKERERYMALTNKELPFDPRRKETPVLGIKKANLRAIKSYKKQNQRYTAKSIKNLW